MAHLVTGYAGEEHITAADQGSFNASFFGEGQFVMEAGNQLEASITSNNNVRILDGDILMQGRHIRINTDTYEDISIETGTAGTNRNDLIVMTYSKDSNTEVEKAYLEVIKGTETTGTATDPEYTEGNIMQGDSFNQMPLYRVKVVGVVLSAVEPMFDTMPTYKALAEKYAEEFETACKTHLDALNVLDTLSEVTDNTEENQLTGALAVKELYDKVKTKYDTSAADLDDYTETGTYYFPASKIPTNSPIQSGGYLIVISPDGLVSSGVKQIWLRQGTINSTDMTTYVRTRATNTWGSWTQVITKKDLSSYIVTVEKEASISSIQAGATTGGSISTSKDGYTFLGVVGFYGGNANVSLDWTQLVTGGVLTFMARNHSSSALSSITAKFKLLYVQE